MQKKLMAVAVAGALAAPGMVLAQTSTVQIGGSLTYFYYHHKIDNSNAGQSTDIMEFSEPELYVHGEERMGGGLTAWFRCTSSLDGMSGGAAAAAAWCGRNSAIGMKGNFGNLFAGNWDMPQKNVVSRARGWFGGTNAFTGGAVRILQSGASGIANTQGTSNSPGFYRRHANSWNYHSPVFSGFQVQAAFSAGNEQTGIPGSRAAGNPRLYSIAAHYDNGPLYLGAGYERHNDYNPANQAFGTAAGQYNGGDDRNWTLVAGYKFANVFDLKAMYSDSEYDVRIGENAKVRGWAVYAHWSLGGPHTLRGQYGNLRDIKGNATVAMAPWSVPGPDTGAQMWALFYSYAMSKRTEVSVGITRMDNDRNAALQYGKKVPTLGGEQQGIGLVMKHRF